MKILHLLGWLALVGMVFGASIVLQKTKPPPPLESPLPSQISSPATSPSHHHKITVKITSLTDLKIKVGDAIQQGTIISDHPQESKELAAKQQQLETDISQLSLPIPPVPPPVPLNLASEEIGLQQAKLKMEQITQNLNASPGLQFKQPELSEIFESDKVRQFNQLHDQQHNAHLEVAAASARLNEAKSRQQQQQYEHHLRVAEYQTRRQRQQYELSSLQSQRQILKDQQHSLTVRSPYSGKVHRIKVVGQHDQQITVEIILLVRNNP